MVVDNRTKLMIGVGASVTANCQPCLKNMVDMARQEGVKDEEILESIGVAKAVRRGASSNMDEFISGLVGHSGKMPDSGEGCGCTSSKGTNNGE